MLDRSILHLTLIVEGIDAIREYTRDLDRAAFLADRRTQDAVAMNFQMIGEAARRLTAENRAEAPEIPWADIVGLRHRIAHDYRHIDFVMVWDILTNEFDILRAAVVRMLTSRGEAAP